MYWLCLPDGVVELEAGPGVAVRLLLAQHELVVDVAAHGGILGGAGLHDILGDAEVTTLDNCQIILLGLAQLR